MHHVQAVHASIPSQEFIDAEAGFGRFYDGHSLWFVSPGERRLRSSCVCKQKVDRQKREAELCGNAKRLPCARRWFAKNEYPIRIEASCNGLEPSASKGAASRSGRARYARPRNACRRRLEKSCI